MGNTVTALKDSTVPQNFNLMCGAIGWDVAEEDCLWWCKTAVSGITDYLNTVKNKANPTVVLVQDLKGNKIIFACVQYIEADDDDEAATGSWTYYWGWDAKDIPENATIYTVDQKPVQKVIAERGANLCRMVMPNKESITNLSVYMFQTIHDALDQQAVDEGDTWTIQCNGYFEASVGVTNGEKQFSFLPMGETKMLIKDDSASEK